MTANEKQATGTDAPPDAKTGDLPVIVGTVAVTESAGTVAAVGTVIGRELRQTETAPISDVIYVQTPHFPLGEADFNRLVDPPARWHQWLPTVRGAWSGAVLFLVTSLASAMAHGERLLISVLPGLCAVGLTTVIWAIVEIRARVGPNPRQETIDRIRRTYQRPTDVAGK
jgi:hypothetical protein